MHCKGDAMAWNCHSEIRLHGLAPMAICLAGLLVSGCQQDSVQDAPRAVSGSLNASSDFYTDAMQALGATRVTRIEFAG